jgi:HEAT repeat protein/PBS lyase HEAT-like repeat-containing protein
MSEGTQGAARTPAREPLEPADAARLTEFARACKAAARAVVLYPGGHPAIGATLARIAHVTSPETLGSPLHLTVLPDTLLLEDRALARADPAVGELAALLSSHLIGRLVINPGGDVEAWRSFLLLLGRTPESVRADGGIARVWTTMAGRHVELREIDYAEVLRERAGGDKATWEKLVANCLQGSAFELNDELLRELMAAAASEETLAELLEAVERGADASDGGTSVKVAALMRMLRTIADAVAKQQPSRMEPVLRTMAAAVGRLSPETLLGILRQRAGGGEGGEIVTAVIGRMTDATIARFVSRDIIANGSPTDRLAQAFQTLVRDTEQQQRLLTMAKEDVAASPLGSTEGFEAAWDHIAETLLTSYSDKPFVSDEYARELSVSRTRAVDVEQVNDDPPERIQTWLSSVATTALRSLDLALVLDLLRLEQNDERWGALMTPVVLLLDDLLLVGDFDAALQVLTVLIAEANEGATPERRQHAMIGLDHLIAGSMMRHIVTHLATIDEAHFERVKTMCVSLGVVIVRPLAETLAVEERPRTRERLTSILVAFGAVARKTIERLKTSPNAAVRRTAIYLMREFGGSEALPDLKELLDDNEPQVQREAVRAILNISTDAAYRILQQALTTGTDRSREAIMQSLTSVRDERATPLFVYIVENVDHRGRLASVYLRAIESLGAQKDPAGVAPLQAALYKGEWWAPVRTRALRDAAAAALARIGTPEALAVLEEASAARQRGVRTAVRLHLVEAQRRQARRGVRAAGAKE